MFSNKIIASATLATAMMVAAPTMADIWWETNEGTLYWEDTVSTFSVFKFFKEGTNDLDHTAAIFVDGTSTYNYTQDLGGRTFGGIWFFYGESSESCGATGVDPYGNSSSIWGTLTMTFEPGGENFSADFKKCATQEVLDTLIGTPGL